MPAGTNCLAYIDLNSTGTANAALAFSESSGGWAGPGWCLSPCVGANKKFPNNARYGQVGISVAFHSVLAHEMGHMLHWPHSYTGVPGSNDYDNAIDVMSGNFGTFGCCSFGTNPDPYASLGINRYAAGWIGTGDVTIHDDDETCLLYTSDAADE